MWTRLNQLINKHSVKWEWVKGHDGNVYNDKADELAQKYIKKIKLILLQKFFFEFLFFQLQKTV